MAARPTEIAHSLSDKYQALHEAFTALVLDATHFQNSVSMTDATQRGLFNSLTRIMAFSDHVHVALNLMAEDVRSIESTYGEPANSNLIDLDDRFDEFFTKLGAANAKVH
jgi:hypothetical protein